MLNKLFLILILILISAEVFSEERKLEELKIAYINKFLNFISSEDSVGIKNICFQDDYKYLDVAVDFFVINAPEYKLLTITENEEKCDIAYVSTYIPVSGNALIISSEGDAVHYASTIIFYISNDNLRFMIDLDKLKKSKKKISSRLLSLAKIKK